MNQWLTLMHGHISRKKTRFPPSPLKELVLQNLPKGFKQLFSMIWTSSESFFNHFGMFYGWPKPDWTDRSQLDNLINLINKARFSISWMMTTRHSRYWLDSCTTRMYVVANQLGFFNYVWDIPNWSSQEEKLPYSVLDRTLMATIKLGSDQQLLISICLLSSVLTNQLELCQSHFMLFLLEQQWV